MVVGEVSGHFTKAEREQIKKQLPEVGRYITGSIVASGEDIARVEARIEYLVEAVNRLDRLDYKNALLGTLMSIAVEYSMSTQAVKGLFTFASSQLSGLLGFLRQIGS